MKDNKSISVEVRMTPKEKDILKQYAKDRGLTMSEVVRTAIFQLMNKEQK